MREHRALNAILAPGGITPVYQPIVTFESAPALQGFECLARGPKGTNFESAQVMFEYVRLKHEETVVDRACVAAALAHAPKTPAQPALDRLRHSGMHISLDDIGLGQSNFKMILGVRPDFLKLDRYFVESCHQDRNRQAVIASLVYLASHFGAELVAEGVDCAETAETLKAFGVRFMQGDWLAAPMSADEARTFALSA